MSTSRSVRVEDYPRVATAADEGRQLAMLVRRNGDSLAQRPVRLDRAIQGAYEHQIYINEVHDKGTCVKAVVAGRLPAIERPPHTSFRCAASLTLKPVAATV